MKQHANYGKPFMIDEIEAHRAVIAVEWDKGGDWHYFELLLDYDSETITSDDYFNEFKFEQYTSNVLDIKGLDDDGDTFDVSEITKEYIKYFVDCDYFHNKYSSLFDDEFRYTGNNVSSAYY